MEPETRNPVSRIKYLAPALIWGIFVAYMSLLPAQEVPHLLADLNDKILHGLIYFTLAALIFFGLLRYNFQTAIYNWQLWIIVALCVFYGGIIELAQHYLVPNRKGDEWDFLANTIGAIASVLLLKRIKQKKA